MCENKKIKVGKYECMIRTKDLTNKGCEIADKYSNLIRCKNEVYGLLIIDKGLFYKLKNNNGFNKIFRYASSTINKKIKKDFWKYVEE